MGAVHLELPAWRLVPTVRPLSDTACNQRWSGLLLLLCHAACTFNCSCSQFSIPTVACRHCWALCRAARCGRQHTARFAPVRDFSLSSGCYRTSCATDDFICAHNCRPASIRSMRLWRAAGLAHACMFCNQTPTIYPAFEQLHGPIH